MNIEVNFIDAIDQCNTPFFLFDENIFAQRIEFMRKALSESAEICYAMKANPFILNTAAQLADAVEVCSPGEYEICRHLGIPNKKLVISGVYKDEAFVERVMNSNTAVKRITIESLTQLELISSISRKKEKRTDVLVRLTSGNQFGMELDILKTAINQIVKEPYLRFSGIQFFSGTQKTSAKKIKRELRKLDEIIRDISSECKVEIFELEYGPGLPVDYCDDITSNSFADAILLDELTCALNDMNFEGRKILEIGRGLAASCGVYVTQVVDIKRNAEYDYAIVDGGKHQISYYSPQLALKAPICWIVPRSDNRKEGRWSICGSLCTSNDVLAKQIPANTIGIGDIAVFPNAGAYCMNEGCALLLSRDLPYIYIRNENKDIALIRERFETSLLNMASDNHVAK